MNYMEFIMMGLKSRYAVPTFNALSVFVGIVYAYLMIREMRR